MTTEVMARIAADVMGHPPIVVSVDTSLAVAARTMIERNIGCLPVVDHDLVRALASKRVETQARFGGYV